MFSILSMTYILITGITINNVRSMAITKNIATINYMIQTYTENEKIMRSTHVFTKKSQLVYEIIRSKSKINFSDLWKDARKKDSKIDKNTIMKILKDDLGGVIEVEEEQYSTSSGRSYDTKTYKIRNV